LIYEELTKKRLKTNNYFTKLGLIYIEMRKDTLYLLIALHFPLWIIKDSSWYFSLNVEGDYIFKYVSVSFALITLIISLILVFYAENKMARLENFILTIWLAANTSWMAHELFNIHAAANAAKGFFIFGFLLIPIYSFKLLKDYRAKKLNTPNQDF